MLPYLLFLQLNSPSFVDFQQNVKGSKTRTSTSPFASVCTGKRTHEGQAHDMASTNTRTKTGKQPQSRTHTQTHSRLYVCMYITKPQRRRKKWLKK